MVESTGALQKVDLKAYSQRFHGTQAYFARLYAVAQSNYTPSADKELAINLGMAQAVKEKKLGFYDAFNHLLKFNKKEDGKSEFKCNAKDENWEKKTRLEYEQLLKAKKLEIQNFLKQQLKDSARVGYRELAEIQSNFGFNNESCVMYRKCYNECMAKEDQFEISKKAMLYAFEVNNEHFLGEFSEFASAKDNRKSTIISNMIQVLRGLSSASEPATMANKLANLSDLTVTQMTDLKNILSMEDLSCYVTLVCLSELSRNELKENVLNNSAVLSLLETNPDCAGILENFMLGRFEKFQQQLNVIENKMVYDAYFGRHLAPKAFKKIRVKTLQQYVKPYKVIDIREIAAAFGQPVEIIEQELSDLIASNAIKAKIDSYKKLMHSSKANPQLDCYKNAVKLGDKFIRDTEDMMLKINLIKEEKVLTYRDMSRGQRVGVFE